MTFQPGDISVIYLTSGHSGLIPLLSQALSEPVDSYWNGSHTWFTATGNTELEWRLHPVENFAMPEASRPEELFELAIEGDIDVTHYWEGLEVYTFDDTKITPEELSQYTTSILGVAPDYAGVVDHEVIGNEFERSGGKTSIVQLLIAQMSV